MSWWVGISSSEDNVNVANNTSDIVVTLTVYWDYAWSYAADNPGWSVNIDGASYSGTCNFNTGHASSGSQTVAAIRRTITHNSDGSRSVGFSGGYAGSGSGWQSTSGSRTLTTIPRASSISVAESSVAAGGTQTVTATKKSSSFTDTIKVTLGSHSMTVTSGTAFTIPEEWMTEFPNAASATVTATVTTKKGTTVIGSNSVTFTLTASAYTLTASRTLTPVSTPSAYGSIYVQTLSKVGIAVTASGYQGSSISSIVSTVEDVQYSGASATSGFLVSSGNVTVTTAITDSRGVSRTLTDTISVVEYHTPRLAVTAIAQSATSQCLITLKGAIAPVSNLNAKTYTITWVDNAGNSGTLANAVVFSDYTFDGTSGHPTVEVVHSNIDPTYTYTYTVRATDSSAFTQVIVATGIVCMSRHAGGDGVTFGAEASESGLVCEWDAKIKGTLQVKDNAGSLQSLLDYIHPVGDIYITVSSSFDPNTVWGGTWVRFGNGKTLVGLDEDDTDFDTVEETGGEKTHTLSVNEMPSHTHDFWLGNTSGGKAGFVGTATGSAFYHESHQYTGGGQAHNNLQPYITVYMWKRTA